MSLSDGLGSKKVLFHLDSLSDRPVDLLNALLFLTLPKAVRTDPAAPPASVHTLRISAASPARWRSGSPRPGSLRLDLCSKKSAVGGSEYVSNPLIVRVSSLRLAPSTWGLPWFHRSYVPPPPLNKRKAKSVWLLIRHRMYMKKKFPSRTSLSLTETVQNVCPVQIYTRRNLSFCGTFRIPSLFQIHAVGIHLDTHLIRGLVCSIRTRCAAWIRTDDLLLRRLCCPDNADSSPPSTQS